MPARAERLAFTAAIAIGVLVRVFPITGAGSVVGDGGLFLSMVQDIREAGLTLPAVTSYNQLDIPFVYPPVGLFAAAVVGEGAGVATIDVLRWMPLVTSVLCVVAFALLARRVVPGPAAVAATLAFALMPSAYGWVVAGGGLTRGLGLLFALLAAAVAVGGDAQQRSLRRAVGSGILIGLAFLTHPQAGLFGVIACVVLSWQSPAGTWVRHLGIAGAAASITVLPWIVWVATTTGLGTLLDAGGRAEPIVGLIRMLNLRFSAAPFMDVVGVLGVVGLSVVLMRRSRRLPVFLVLTYVVGAGGGEFLGAVPWALLAGVGLVAIAELGGAALSGASRPTARTIIAGLGALGVFLALIGALGSPADKSSKLHPLRVEQIAAMEWLAENSAPSELVIVPSDEVWGFDDVAEWLPAIAGRRSLGTVQGSEWLGAERFSAQLERHEAIEGCAGSVAACYRSIDPTALIFVPKGQLNGPLSPRDCCPALRATLVEAGYEIIYDESGATIARPAS